VSEHLSSLVLATTNPGKAADFKLLFEPVGISISLPGDHGIALDVEETEPTFEGNALLKARAYARELEGVAILADDSGLSVRALGGAPGVLSARYAGPDCDDHSNNVKLLDDLRDVEDRYAEFICALALVLPDGREIVTLGRCPGTIIDEERGDQGFGYDVVFYREDLGRTFGESTPEEKNARSHRAAAVHAMIGELEALGLTTAQF
jgi:XTP/dITP diphosphohydrolase